MLATIGENRDMVRKRGIGESKDITMRERKSWKHLEGLNVREKE